MMEPASFGEAFLLKKRSFFKRLIVTLVVATAGFFLISGMYSASETDFPSIIIVILTIFITLYSGLIFGLASAISVTLLIDFRLLPPVGHLFFDRLAWAHFLIVCATALASGFLISVLRGFLERANFAKDEAERARKQAQEATAIKSQFLANMSHEIRTPLGAIMGFSELLMDQRISDSEKSKYVASIKRNGELLSNIINDILDLSKVEAGRLEVDITEAALEDVLVDIKTMLSLQAAEKGINLKIHVDRDVPEIIKTDPLRLRQILINLVGNAIKFTAKGFVQVSVRRDGKYLSFVVEDSGKGIERDQIAKLFAPFSQANPTLKRTFGGTGLGLILSKRLAVLLGGDVVLTRTESNRGSTFCATIDPGPFLGKYYGGSTHEESSSRFENELRRLNGVKVLLAEDAPENQILVSRILQLAGASVEIASDGREAIEKASRANYDVILMDLQMPVMDGYESTGELRKRGYRGKIVALTAHAFAEEKQRCLRSGFDAHLSKPVNSGRLLEEIDVLTHQVH